jgi:hypothetical protein
MMGFFTLRSVNRNAPSVTIERTRGAMTMACARDRQHRSQGLHEFAFITFFQPWISELEKANTRRIIDLRA